MHASGQPTNAKILGLLVAIRDELARSKTASSNAPANSRSSPSDSGR
jgi:hypothetical protein